MWKIELEKVPLEGRSPAHSAEIILNPLTSTGDEGMLSLSPELASMLELEENLYRIRKQLDQVERAGRKYFSTP